MENLILSQPSKSNAKLGRKKLKLYRSDGCKKTPKMKALEFKRLNPILHF